MIVFRNPHAGGGKAFARWKRVESELTPRIPLAAVCICETPHDILRMLPAMVESGERHFVAAGGDGTVNALLNAVMSLPHEHQNSIVIGAIGLGSSNAFHKPTSRASLISGISCLVNVASARSRDVGVFTYCMNGATLHRHFLINASIGLTAEANRFFNNPDRILALLKRRSTVLGIGYAMLRTLVAYANTTTQLWLTGGGTLRLRLTNLAIMKSPHVSGSIAFPMQPEMDTGFFGICLADSLGVAGRMRLVTCLIRGSLPESRTIRVWRAPILSLRSDHQFAVECDGEILHTTAATFSILPRHLRVCTLGFELKGDGSGAVPPSRSRIFVRGLRPEGHRW